MSKYIDAEKLTELISQTEKEFTEKSKTKGYTTLEYQHKAEGLQLALQYITSLQQEQPEVDLEKALDEYYKNEDFGPSEAIEYEIHKDIARHFYELGLNAKKEE